MKISVEISMYPFSDDYIPPIRDFIAALNNYGGVEVLTNTMSTQVFGEFEEVMAALQGAMHRTMSKAPKAVFVTKFLGSDVRSTKE